MPKFSKKSFDYLKTCDLRLVNLFAEVVKHFDCRVIEGERGATKQMKYYHSIPRRTKLVYPLSKHNPTIYAPVVASILGCCETMEDIKKSIVVAREEQLVEIDNIAPLEKSRAVDVIPYPVCWDFEEELWYAAKKICSNSGISKEARKFLEITHNIERWFMFIGFVKATAVQMGIKIISGADWDGDHQMSDQRFDDLPHFELRV